MSGTSLLSTSIFFCSCVSRAAVRVSPCFLIPNSSLIDWFSWVRCTYS